MIIRSARVHELIARAIQLSQALLPLPSAFDPVNEHCLVVLSRILDHSP
jgi:hypothetical protein